MSTCFYHNVMKWNSAEESITRVQLWHKMIDDIWSKLYDRIWIPFFNMSSAFIEKYFRFPKKFKICWHRL